MKTVINEFKVEQLSKITTKISYDENCSDLQYVYSHIGHDDAVIPDGHLRILADGTSVHGIWNFPLDYLHDEFYGLGDKSGPLNRRGQRFSMYNKDALAYDASYSDPLYKSVPFFIRKNSSSGVLTGFYFPCNEIDFVDFGRESPLFFSVSVKDGPFSYYRFDGHDESEILDAYYDITGHPYFPPLYSFGYFGSSMNYVECDDAQSRILEFFSKIEQKNIPCEGLYLSSGYVKHSDGKRYTFIWNYDKFPDPVKFFGDLEGRGYKVIENIKPGFLTTHPLYSELDSKGYFIKDISGNTVVEYYWGGKASFVDFDNPDAVLWWKSMLKSQPCKGIWNDNNELELEDSDIPWSHKRITYPVLMSEVAYEAKKEQFPDERPWIYSRAGTTGIQKYARTWSGDNTSTFDTLKYNQFMGINMGLSGIPFYGHDLGGFYGDTPSPELLKLSCRSGVLQSRFVIHSWRESGNPTEPWIYPEIEDEILGYINAHYMLLPYIYASAYNCVKNSVPMERPFNGETLFGNCIIKHSDFTYSYLPGSAIVHCSKNVRNSSEIFDELAVTIVPPDSNTAEHESIIFADDGVSELSLDKYTEIRLIVKHEFILVNKVRLNYTGTKKITFIFPNKEISFGSFAEIPTKIFFDK